MMVMAKENKYNLGTDVHSQLTVLTHHSKYMNIKKKNRLEAEDLDMIIEYWLESTSY